MKRLVIWRHAKAASKALVEDFHRPLNARGQRDAEKMARFLIDSGSVPGLVLCSSAVRTRQTLMTLLSALSDCGADLPEIHYLQSLYDRMDDDYLADLRNWGQPGRDILLVGHNNAVSITAMTLVGPGSLNHDIVEGYPTGAMLSLTFASDDWDGIGRERPIEASFEAP